MDIGVTRNYGDHTKKCCTHCGFVETYSSYRLECPICERDLKKISELKK